MDKVDSDLSSMTSKSEVSKASSRHRSKSRGRLNRESLTGATLKSILKRKGDQTAGKRSITSRKSSIKFNKLVSSRLVDTAASDDEVHNTDLLLQYNVSLDPDIAKSVIETTLLKSADVLSEFTENTITQAASYVNNFFAPDRFGVNKVRQRRSRSRPWSGSASSSSITAGHATEKIMPDISKFPPQIADLLKSDSDESITTKGSANSKNYHSRKLALKQNSGFHSKSNPIVPVKVFADSRAPNIVVVAAPDLKTMKPKLKGTSNKAPRAPKSEIMGIKKDEATDMFDVGTLDSMLPQSRKSKRTAGVSGVSSHRPLRKPHKMQLGVENGVVFIIGPKTKIPYVNSFGETKELTTLKQMSSSCRWIVNVGNFHDNELSFSALEANLTITGFRHPTLRYPDGQTVTETVKMPVSFDIKNLRIYRPSNVNDLLVLEEAESKVLITSPTDKVR